MIITQTPFRVSFFGGGTDYPSWVSEHGGAVLGTSIDKYCYICCRELPPFFEYDYRVVYSRIEHAKRVSDIEHPAVRACLNDVDLGRGIEIINNADLPARTGLGSSSSFTVGLLHALRVLKGLPVETAELARSAIRLEQTVMRENVGSQDQVLAAHGGLNHVIFQPGGDIDVHPVILAPERLEALESRLMMFFTGISRTASEVAGEQIQSIPQKTTELSTMRAMVDEGLAILTSQRDIADFGRLLHESWKLKRSLSRRISVALVDEMYETALACGAIGGKLLGAGGGGFLLIFAEPERQPAIRQALADYLHVPFRLDTTGSRLIFKNS